MNLKFEQHNFNYFPTSFFKKGGGSPVRNALDQKLFSLLWFLGDLLFSMLLTK